MSQRVRISLDAMGGDHGPSTVVPVRGSPASAHPETTILMFRRRAVLTPLVAAEPRLKGAVEIRHTHRLGGDGRESEPGGALRPRQVVDVKAIQAVRDGEADAAVSAGNIPAP